uniref:Uncharacterized protein n=1 Tax=Anguilla anguilla TaxID=7936 RepID=A0A0E9T218_ANGAN
MIWNKIKTNNTSQMLELLKSLKKKTLNKPLPF